MILSTLRTLVRERTADVLKSKNKTLDLPRFDLSIPPSKVPGDLAANIVLMIAKSLGQPPRALAEEILKGFAGDSLIEKAEIAGPGFLNFWLKDQALRDELAGILGGEKDLEKNRTTEKILLEFVSANPTGPLHVGHGRGAALGDSLVRVLRYLGHQVTAEFYINDAGGQIRNLGFSVEARVKELKGEKVEFPENGYKGAYVTEIAKEALASGKTFKPVAANQMLFDENDLAGYASEKNLNVIKKDLDSFNVHFDAWFPESTLHKKGAVPKLYDELKKRDLCYEQDGALWFRATNFGDEKDRVLQKASEAPTYFASDIAYHMEKFGRGFDRLINIWGADHHSYALRLKASMKSLGFQEDKLHVILNQLVSIKGGRLSKRAGDMITLRDLIDEVGVDAARFFFALRSPGAHFEFDLDLAKKQASDNPVFYVQYVHARCCSIVQEAKKRGVFAEPLRWRSEKIETPLQPAEKSVLLHLMNFDSAVEVCAKDQSNHHLTQYLIELAGKYHSFYETCTVLVDDAPLRSFRLDLVEAIRRRVAQGLDLLGVSAPEKL